MGDFAAAIGKLRAAAVNFTTVTQGVQSTIQGIKDRYEAEIRALKARNPEVDTTELEALTQEVQNNVDTLAAAVVVGTTADPNAGPTTPVNEPGPTAEPPLPPVDQIVNPPEGQA